MILFTQKYITRQNNIISIILALFLIMGGVLIGAETVRADTSTGLVGHWTFDSVNTNWSASTTADSSGNSHTGSLSGFNSSTSTVAGPVGDALSFDGVNDQINITDAPDLRLNGDLTISLWIKPILVSGKTTLLIRKTTSTIAKPGEFRLGRLEASSPTGTVLCMGNISTSVCPGIYSSFPPATNYITYGAWQHLVVIRDTVASTTTTYRNGTLIDNSESFGTISISTTTNNINIGGLDAGVHTTYKGFMDDVRLYNRTLSGSDAAELYALGSGTDTEAPSVSITSPSNGATVNNRITISASVTDDIAPERVYFYYATSTLTLIASTTSPTSGDTYSQSWTPSITTGGAGSYTLYVVARDGRPNYATSTIIVNVDVTKPVISNVTAGSINQTGATITWDTDEVVDMAVEYGETAALGSVTTRDNATTTSHTFKLIYLKPQTTYYYRVTSRDQLTNTATSSISSFTTLDADLPGSTSNCIVASTGDTFYVSPTATYGSGNGSCASPWNFYTALAQPAAVGPGDTIYLRGGLYRGSYMSSLAGTANNPITVMSYPGEWARVDGYVYNYLAEDISASQTTIPLVDASEFSPVSQGTGYVVNIGPFDPNSPTGYLGIERIVGEGTTGNTINVAVAGYRGWNGSTASSWPAGTIVKSMMTTFTINGHDAIYRDFEVYNSDPVRSLSYNYNLGQWMRQPSFAVFGYRTKYINLVVHDNQDFGFWQNATSSEIYGLLSYNVGFGDTVTGNVGHGHGIYIDNSDAANKKTISEVITFNQSGTGMKAFGESGWAIGVDFNGIISFNNGSMTLAPGNQAGLASNVRMNNLLIGTAVNPPSDDSITNSYFYHPLNVSATNLRIGYLANESDNFTMTGNYIAGGTSLLSLLGWRTTLFSNNTLVTNSSNTYGVLGATATTSSVWTWNNNTYYEPSPTGFSFSYTSPELGSNGDRSFNGWKAFTGFDTNSTYTAALPTTNAIFVRPNQYEAGRANIAIYNWEGLSSVTVDLSTTTLSDGDGYSIYNVQNASYEYPYGSIVASSTYDSSDPLVSIPMTDTGVAQPIGQMFTPASTLPQFGAFIVRRTSVAAVAQTSTPTPTPTASASSGSTSSGGSSAFNLVLLPDGSYGLAPKNATPTTLSPSNTPTFTQPASVISSIISKLSPKSSPVSSSPQPLVNLSTPITTITTALKNFILSSLTPVQKETIPPLAVFSKPKDIPTYTSTEQKDIHTLEGKDIELSVKPDHPVTKITGYLTIQKLSFKQAINDLKTHNSSQSASLGTLVEDKLVLSTFSYSDPDHDGIYTATVTAPKVHGEYDILTVLEYQDNKLTPKELHMTAVVDPEGYVYVKTKLGETRVENARVILQSKNIDGTYVTWPATDYKQTNPQTTDKTGTYSFLVPEGSYKLSVSASGYYDYTGTEFQVVQDAGVHENIELLQKSWWGTLLRWITGKK